MWIAQPAVPSPKRVGRPADRRAWPLRDDSLLQLRSGRLARPLRGDVLPSSPGCLPCHLPMGDVLRHQRSGAGVSRAVRTRLTGAVQRRRRRVRSPAGPTSFLFVVPGAVLGGGSCTWRGRPWLGPLVFAIMVVAVPVLLWPPMLTGNTTCATVLRVSSVARPASAATPVGAGPGSPGWSSRRTDPDRRVRSRHRCRRPPRGGHVAADDRAVPVPPSLLVTGLLAGIVGLPSENMLTIRRLVGLDDERLAAVPDVRRASEASASCRPSAAATNRSPTTPADRSEVVVNP